MDVLPLDRTYDSRLLHRAVSSIKWSCLPHRLRRAFGACDFLIARNLEMLTIAASAKHALGGHAAIVYEVLDIHRLLLGAGPLAVAMRQFERRLLRHVDLLMTSSPAFLREHYERRQFGRKSIPAMLVENKVLRLSKEPGEDGQAEPPPGPPWRIGWFGVIRCRRSLSILSALARRRPDLVRIEIAGRPPGRVFADFEAEVRSVPSLAFNGPYAPKDLGRLYGSVHFNWAIDYFEEDANSEWLLPNRLYEGGRYDAVPLALRRTETGRWLRTRGLGVLMDDPAKELEAFLDNLSPAGYRKLKAACAAVPRATFEAGISDCAWIVAVMTGTAAERHKTLLHSRAAEMA